MAGTFSASGRDWTSKLFTATTGGVTISFAVPVRSFIIKPSGGAINFKKLSGDADSDAFPIADGESLAIDLSLAFPIATNTSTVGIAFTAAGTVSVYVIAAF